MSESDHSPLPEPSDRLTVTGSEHGMKLLRFLERRLAGRMPLSMLHKWIRTGQVRVNKGRSGAYRLLATGDAVRVPPFALLRASNPESRVGDAEYQRLAGVLGPGLTLIDLTDEYVVLGKPAGLASQSGSGVGDSVAGRLREAFAQYPFVPAPAHRLDKQTSGLMIAGRTHEAQRRLHARFHDGGMRKEYLALVAGVWPHATAVLLLDILGTSRDASGYERMAARAGGRTLPLPIRNSAPLTEPGVSACVVVPVRFEGAGPCGAGASSVLLLRLLTGHKHQIRVQLASRGFSIIGDTRYGGLEFPRLLLHAHTLAIGLGTPEDSSQEWRLPPDWSASCLPDADALDEARRVLAVASAALPG